MSPETPETDGLVASINSPTPDTDDLARGNHVVPTEWAQQLERERDEARRLREKEMVDAIHSCHQECPRRMCVMRRELHEMKNLNWDLIDRLSKALDAVSVLQAEVETLRNVTAAQGVKTHGN
jgi:hypothetical protein